MTRSAKAQELEAKRKAMRERFQKRRKNPRKKKKDKSRRIWWLLLILALLMVLCLRDCRCNEPPPGVVPQVEEPGEAGPAEPDEPPVVQPTGTIKRQDRPEFVGPPPEPLPWIAAFRMQVAARGPRLAGCFEGAAGPGTLRWTVSVEPNEGAVSDHVIEPSLQSAELTKLQRRCVIDVLSSPPYNLSGLKGLDGVELETRTTPSRVGMVIEFSAGRGPQRHLPPPRFGDLHPAPLVESAVLAL